MSLITFSKALLPGMDTWEVIALWKLWAQKGCHSLVSRISHPDCRRKPTRVGRGLSGARGTKRGAARGTPGHPAWSSPTHPMGLEVPQPSGHLGGAGHMAGRPGLLSELTRKKRAAQAKPGQKRTKSL